MRQINAFLSILGIFLAGCSNASSPAADGKPPVTAEKLTQLAKQKPSSVARCPVMGNEVNKALSAEYKGGKVYFCCPPCVSAFKKETSQFAADANAQLVATGQAKQVKCPISEKPLDANSPTSVVDGVKVSVADAASLKELESLDETKRIERVFGDKTFAKAFAVKGGAGK